MTYLCTLPHPWVKGCFHSAARDHLLLKVVSMWTVGAGRHAVILVNVSIIIRLFFSLRTGPVDIKTSIHWVLTAMDSIAIVRLYPGFHGFLYIGTETSDQP